MGSCNVWNQPQKCAPLFVVMVRILFVNDSEWHLKNWITKEYLSPSQILPYLMTIKMIAWNDCLCFAFCQGNTFFKRIVSTPLGYFSLLNKKIQQFTQVPDFICDLQTLWPSFACGIVRTGINAIIHAALNIGGEAIADDQDVASGGCSRTACRPHRTITGGSVFSWGFPNPSPALP